MDTLLETFDDYVDDLLSSDLSLLKGELDFLIMQHIFQSMDLDVIKKDNYQNKESLAA